MTFGVRPASTAWEPLVDGVGPVGWVWWHPSDAPTDVLVSPGTERPHSARSLIAACGLPPQAVVNWTAAGGWYETHGGQNPLLDHPLPAGLAEPIRFRLALAAPSHASAVPGAANPPGLHAAAATPPAAATAPQPVSGPCEVSQDQAERLLAAIDADWHSVLKLERDLAAKKKELESLAGRIGSLNRDLNADERRFADSNDLREWQDAKRWMRDAQSKLSRIARDFDLGVVSSAGARNRFEQVYQQYVASRTPFAGIMQTAKEFEQHRKTAQQLLQSMGSAHSAASRDGEGRAKQILARIAAKARKGRRK